MPFHLWLQQIAKDRLIDAHRRDRVAARRSLDRKQPLAVSLPNNDTTYNLATQLCDSELTPAAGATWKELERRFGSACTELNPQDEEMVLMRYSEQLSNSEVAQALDLSPQATSMRYLRAIRRLRTLMVDEDTNNAS